MTEESTVVEAETTQEQQTARDFDKEAREMGWVPEAEFKGPKEKWKPAQNFVEDGEKILPIVRSQLKREREEREREKADFAKRLERIERVNKTTFEAAQRAHEAEISRLKSAQRAAVEAGDTKEFDRLETEKGKLEKQAPKVEEAEPSDPKADLATRQAKWRADNTWFDEDFDLQDWAVRYSDFHGNKNPHLSFEENMAAVTAEAKKRFPDKFGGKKPAGNSQSAVDSGSDFSGFTSKKGLADKLPAEARRQAEKDVSAKHYKTVEDWAKVYFDQK
jgi:hypothetical protein